MKLVTRDAHNPQVCPHCQKATENSFWDDTEWCYQACPCGFMARYSLAEARGMPAHLKSPGGKWMDEVAWCWQWALEHPDGVA